jgi:RNA polymerase sigma factor (sigma-70 family)
VAIWRDNKVEELAKQLTYSPAEKRLEQIAAASVLIDEVDATKTYPWDYVQYRITGYRPKEPVEYAVAGKTLRADLSVFIEFLSDTLQVRADAQGEPVLTLEDVTKQFAVSSKTIQRWRKQGLVAQRYVFADNRKKLGFLKSNVAKFATANAQRVASAGTFRQLSDEERAKIIEWARRLAKKCQCCLKDISRRIARHTGRSPETIRYTIRKHDREHPEAAVFAAPQTLAEQVGELDRQIITACFDNGVSVDCLAKRYCRTRTSIYRAVTQERAERLRKLKIEFIPNPLFDHPDADTIILDVLPKESVEQAKATVAAGTNAKAKDLYAARLPKDLPAYLAGVFLEPVMPAEIEADLVRRMNYLKCAAAKRVAAINLQAVKADELAAIEALLEQATAIKNQLVQANLRVAIHVARKHQRVGLDLMELVSDATIWLMRAVEKFDFARGVRLSTYASWAIMKNFARDRAEQLTRRDAKFVTGQEDVLSQARERDTAGVAEQVDASAEKRDLMDVIGMLPARERELVLMHYGLDDAHTPLSLAELGEKLGITKARVRQLEARALKKLRHLLERRREARLAAEPRAAVTV